MVKVSISRRDAESEEAQSLSDECIDRTLWSLPPQSIVYSSPKRSNAMASEQSSISISKIDTLQKDPKHNMDFIVKCVDTAIKRYIEDPATEQLSLEIEISQLVWRERRLSQVFIPMSVEEKRFKTLQQRLEMIQYVPNAKPDAHERRRRVRKACDKLREHILEMRPFNSFPSRHSFSAASLLGDSGTSTARPVAHGAAVSFGAQSLQKHVADVCTTRSRSASPFLRSNRSSLSKSPKN
ncbi:hypothetical protein QR680_017604 [Steinernema hermaphroditum]|uniref:Uncharacterized protein n=1 Tax=Steinernema hermaphroditum TaxID=289476 RepID=A0AA39HGD5_9BILA|nr:hypothetical protein QR680_017604 [Steinernema hermaphroditum]